MPRTTQVQKRRFVYFRVRDYHPLRFRFPADSANKRIFNPLSESRNRLLYGACCVALMCLCPTTPRSPYLRMDGGLGSSRFARRYLGNIALLREHCFLFLCLLRCFSSAGTRRPLLSRPGQCGLRTEVSPFGNLRIKGRSTPPRSLSQLRHVLHRCHVPRHPPYALNAINRPSERS